MFIIIGAIVVTVGVIVGFLMAGGNLIVLLQISEFVTIGGAAIGSLLISAPLETIKQIIAAIPKAIKGNHVSKKDYMDLLIIFI